MIASLLLHCPNLGPLESDGVKLQNSLLDDTEVNKIVPMGSAFRYWYNYNNITGIEVDIHHLWQ